MDSRRGWQRRSAGQNEQNHQGRIFQEERSKSKVITMAECSETREAGSDGRGTGQEGTGPGGAGAPVVRTGS